MRHPKLHTLLVRDRLKPLVAEYATITGNDAPPTPTMQLLCYDLAALGRQTGTLGIPGMTVIELKETVKI